VAATFLPREHGATAMLLTPFGSAAILLRRVDWAEAAALLAVVLVFAARDPLVVLLRQRLVWKQEHAETREAKRWLAAELILLAACGGVLAWEGPLLPFAVLGIGAAAFTLLAVWMNVRNRQRSEWFQVASAAGLSASSLAACLAVQKAIPPWGWLLWLLCTLQSVAGIFVVHARLDARMALRGGRGATAPPKAAWLAVAALAVAALAFLKLPWIAAALLSAAAGYGWELRRQRTPEGLQMRLQRVGQQLLALSVSYAVLAIVGLW